YLGLHALQHRGQEAAGIVSADGGGLRAHRGMGLVADTFGTAALEKLPGRAAIGHVRYATAGSSDLRNAQPLTIEYAHGHRPSAEHGNLSNDGSIRARLEASASIFQSSADTEVIVPLIAHAREPDIVDRVVTALKQVEGAYSLLFQTESKLIAARDPHGFRPLALGRLRDSFVFASETCAFDLIEAEFIRELEAGEVVVIDAGGKRSLRPFGPPPEPRF